MARRPSRTASSTSSSGALAPSRKLYAECACNSAYATDERIRRPSSGGWYAIRLRDQGASSAGVHTVGVPERRGFPESTRSISDQPGGRLLQPTDPVYRMYVRYSRCLRHAQDRCIAVQKLSSRLLNRPRSAEEILKHQDHSGKDSRCPDSVWESWTSVSSPAQRPRV